MTRPLVVVSSASDGRTTRRSSSGCKLIDWPPRQCVRTSLALEGGECQIANVTAAPACGKCGPGRQGRAVRTRAANATEPGPWARLRAGLQDRADAQPAKV